MKNLILIMLFSVSSYAVENQFKDIYGEMEKMYQDLHQNPELSFQEKSTAQKLTIYLENLGYKIQKDIGGFGFVGILENGKGPTLLIRTDLDALPVLEKNNLAYKSKVIMKDHQGIDVPVMHACGHDIHMSVFLGTAKAMVQIKDSWSGTLIMLGQPAEEWGAGAKAMIKDNLFKKISKPDFAIAIHTEAEIPTGKIGLLAGPNLAGVDDVDIKVYGIGGHGAFPHKTVDPIVLASKIILSLQTIISRELDPVDAGVITVGKISGGTKRNIIPELVEMNLTVRSLTPATRKILVDGIKRISRFEGLAAGLPESKLPEVMVSDEQTAPPLINNENLANRLKKSIGEKQGINIFHPLRQQMGAEDFAYFGTTSHKIPLTMIRLGIVPLKKYNEAKRKSIKLPSLHSPEIEFDISSIKTGIDTMTNSALELLKK